MNQLHVFPDSQSLSEVAAKWSLDILRSSIEAHDVAVWVLAGGSTPLLAYRYIADHHLKSIDWSKVTFLLGDERSGPLDSPDNNWHAIETILLHHIPEATFIRPKSDLAADEAAADYEKQLLVLPQAKPGFPRLDLVWLGMGEDGHTLSLFPGDTTLAPTNQLVTPVHNSPKPPSDRISLTLHALEGAEQVMILTGGSAKTAVLPEALRPDSMLPIAQAARISKTQWLLDAAAAAKLTDIPS